MGFKAYWNIDTDLMKHSYRATEALLSIVVTPLSPTQPIIIASFVNVDDLEQSSTFGRIVSEYVASRLSQLGYKVIEMKLRKSIFVKKDGGEFILSREAKNIYTEHQAQAAFLGIYAIASTHVNVSARIVNLNDSTIIASYDYQIPLSDDIYEMVTPKASKPQPYAFMPPW